MVVTNEHAPSPSVDTGSKTTASARRRVRLEDPEVSGTRHLKSDRGCRRA